MALNTLELGNQSYLQHIISGMLRRTRVVYGSCKMRFSTGGIRAIVQQHTADNRSWTGQVVSTLAGDPSQKKD